MGSKSIFLAGHGAHHYERIERADDKGERVIKLFGTGAQRTGTMSLTQALNMLEISTRQFAPELYGNIHHGIMDCYRGFTDFPIPLIYRELDAAYPGSKFIHTIRDEASWLKSVEWLFTVGSAKFNWDRNPIFDQVHLDFYGTVSYEPERFLQRFRDYNAEVISYFQGRPDDFLLIDITKGDGFAKICPFLGVPIPERSFPHGNQTEAHWRVLGRNAWRRVKGKRPKDV